jgi:hypothetical protein
MQAPDLASPSSRYVPAKLLSDLGVSAKAAGSHNNGTNVLRRVHATSPDPTRVCVEGERTEHLTRLAGRYVAEGRPIEEVKLLCQSWNSGNNPPLDVDKVDRTCDSILKTHWRNHPTSGSSPQAGVVAPLFSRQDVSVGLMLKTQPPRRRWLLQNLLPLGKVGAIIAPGGTGKSQLALQLAIAVATGTKLAGTWDVGEKGDVLVLTAEDDLDEIHRRLERTVPHIVKLSASAGPDIRQHLFIKALVGCDNLMTRADASNAVAPTEFVERLLLTFAIEFPDLKLIIIDPLSRFRGGNENSAEDVTRWVEQAERLALATGATVVVLHHTNKASYSALDVSQGASRGSSAFADGVRFVLNLAPAREKTLKAAGIQNGTPHLLEAVVTKNNYAPPSDAVVLVRENDGYLTRLGTQSGGQPVTLEDRILKLVSDEAMQGRTYSKSAFEKKFGGQAGPLQIGFVTVRDKLQALLQAGELRKQSTKLVARPIKPLGATP